MNVDPMVSTTEDQDQPADSAGGNGGNQQMNYKEGGGSSSNAIGNNKEETVKKSGAEEGGKLTGNRGKDDYLGSPHHLKEKIARGIEEKKEKDREEQTKRKEAYGKDRRKGIKKDKEMEMPTETFKFTSVQVKKEAIEGASSTKGAEIDLTKDDKGDEVELVIDLTKKKRKAGEIIKANIKESKQAARQEAKTAKEGKATKKGGKKGEGKKKGKKAKKVVSAAAQSVINLTKGIGRAKAAKGKNSGKPEGKIGFDFGIKSSSEDKKDTKKGAEKEAAKQTNGSGGAPATVSPIKQKPVNVYQGAAARAKARTEKNRQMVLGSRTKYRGSRRFRVTFTTKAKRNYNGGDNDLSLYQQSEELRMVLVNILARAQATCKRASIQPWVGEKDQEMPTIVDKTRVPKTWGELRRYITHDDDQFKIQGVRAGNNARWRVLINFDMNDHEEFLHLYQTSKGEWNEFPYVPIVDAPLQDEHYHCLGFLINSSADQPTRINEEGLSAELGFAVGLSFGNMPMDREYQNIKWEEARNEGSGKRDTFRNAPQSMNVYVNEKSLQARAVMAKKMAAVYGVMQEGKYPIFPDGSRMRFMPNHKLVPFNKRTVLETYANLQVTLKKEAVELDIGVKDLNTKPRTKESGDRTIGELVLGLSTGDTQLPIFRHFTKRYSRRYDPLAWCVSVHPNMSLTAVETMSKLKEIITDKYGEEAGKLIGKADSYASKAGIQNSTFKPDESGFEFLDVSKDWYLSGNAKCMIDGMDVLETPEEKEAMDKAVQSIDESKMTFLSNANTAEEEKTVATTGGVSFGDTVSQLSYDSEKSARDGHISGEESTMEMQGFEPEHEEQEKSEETQTGNPSEDNKAEGTENPESKGQSNQNAVKNVKTDGGGGSGTQTISDEGTWTRHGTAAAEKSLFETAVKFGLKSLASLSPTTKSGVSNKGVNESGAGGTPSGTEQP